MSAGNHEAVDRKGGDPSPINAVTVDVEDWQQSVLDPDLPLSDRFCRNTHKVLEAFAAHNVRGTFFVLGLAAEKAPALIREIQEAGHEVQSHGYGHRLVYNLDRKAFRDDIDRAKKLLEDITGRPVIGYRAPAFTITVESLWALDALFEAGFQYDSSIFPMKIRHYGIDGAPRFPHRLRTPAGYELTEVPVACGECCGHRIPIGGGGYFRLFPYGLLRRGLRQINRLQHSAVVYMHPYEYDPDEFEALGYAVPLLRRLHQGLGRRSLPRKIDALLTEFRFGRIRDVLDNYKHLPLHTHSVSGKSPP